MTKRLIAILLTLLLALAAAGCAAQSAPQGAEAAISEPAAEPAAEQETAYSGAGNAGVYADVAGAPVAGQYGGHKVIATYSLEMTTNAFDEHYSLLLKKAEELGGYVQAGNVWGTKPEAYDDSGRRAELTFRIPAEKAEAFVAYAGGTGEVTHNSKSTEDVTLDYYDNETRLEVLRTQLDRLKSILVETDNLADIIELEQAIADVTLEIEQLTTQLRRYDDLIDYSTVSVFMYEERLLTGPAATKSVGQRINEGFLSNLSGVGVFFTNFFVWLVSALPVLLVLAAAGLLVYWIIRRIIRKGRGGPGGPQGPEQARPFWQAPQQPETKEEKDGKQ